VVTTNAKLPSTPAPVAEKITSGKVYYVQPGDTLWDISRMYEGLSVEKIKKLNKLTSNKIKPGQKLIIG
jgi:membrane-bound lytic murein transglycosylase D